MASHPAQQQTTRFNDSVHLAVHDAFRLYGRRIRPKIEQRATDRTMSYEADPSISAGAPASHIYPIHARISKSN